MSFKVKKYSLLKKKKKNSFLNRSGIVNIWHLPKLTEKQKKTIFSQKKRFLNELGRKVYKYRFHKTLFPSSQKDFEKNKSQLNRNLKSPEKLFFEKKYSREILKKQKSIYRNRMWFFDTAAPIPGVSFLKKQKKFYREKMHAYKTFRTYLCIFNKKQIIDFMKRIQKSSKSKNWASFVLMDSIFRASLRKRGFVKNPKRRKGFSKYCLMNGKFRKKQNFVLMRGKKTVQKPADFCFLNNRGRKKLFLS